MQSHSETILPVSLGDNHASVTWEQSCQCHLGAIEEFHLGTIVLVSLGDDRASFTWEQSCQCHLGIIVVMSLGYNCASFIWEESSQFNLEITFRLKKEMGNDTRYLRSFSLQNLNVSIYYIIDFLLAKICGYLIIHG